MKEKDKVFYHVVIEMLYWVKAPYIVFNRIIVIVLVLSLLKIWNMRDQKYVIVHVIIVYINWLKRPLLR